MTRPDEPQIHLGVFFTGVGPNLLWTEPDFPDHTAVDTFVDTVRLLERGLFDAFFLGEGLRVRENRGQVYDLDVAGRPDAISQLSALAAVTEHIGLVATQNTTYNYPADLARRLASLDHLSAGRAGWNIVTTDNAWTGANFRHGGWLPHERRYERAAAFVEAAKELWASDGTEPVERDTDLVRLRSRATVPPSPQEGPCSSRPATPVVAGNWRPAMPTSSSPPTPSTPRPPPTPPTSPRGSPGTGAPGVAAHPPRRLRGPRRHAGRGTRQGPVDPRAADQRPPRRRVPGALLGHGPVRLRPRRAAARHRAGRGRTRPSRGTLRVEQRTGKLEQIQKWRDLAAERGLTIRQLVTEVSGGHPAFVGTPGSVADEWARYVRTRAVDGFNLLPDRLPASLTEIVDRLVPALQERGLYRTAYTGRTLRDHLALPPAA
ncbi:LLM class flavin-dependent oxidoreductase [Streptacidiphilus monticola]